MIFGLMILKNLLRRKVRSLLTVVGISIGIAALVALVAITRGFVATFEGMMKSRGTDLSVMKANTADILMSILDQSIGEKIRAIDGVKNVAGILVDMVSIEDKPAVIVIGTDPGEYVINHFKIQEGRTLDDSEGRGAMLGRIAATNLKKGIGNEIDMETDVFTIVGIFESGNVWEDGAVVVPIKTLQALIDRKNQVTVFNVKLTDPLRADEVKKEAMTVLHGVSVMTSNEVTETNQGLQMAKALSWGTSMIALAVGAIGTMNTMIMSVFERTKEIGILRALGWRRRKILRMILGESLFLSIIGGGLGLVLGTMGVHALSNIPSLQGLIFGDLSRSLYLEAMGVALLLGIFGGFYPAYRGASISPMEALRYE